VPHDRWDALLARAIAARDACEHSDLVDVAVRDETSRAPWRVHHEAVGIELDPATAPRDALAA
jgi:hypothetical protein